MKTQVQIESRLTSIVVRLLTGILGQQIEVQFIVMETPEEEDGPEIENPVPDAHPDILSLQAEYQSIYDEIVRPDQVIVVPGYFLRYIPLLGVELAWLYVGVARRLMKRVQPDSPVRSSTRRRKRSPGILG